MAGWPLPRRINPYYGDVSEESANWIRSFHAFSPAAQKAFDKCNFGRQFSAVHSRYSKLISCWQVCLLAFLTRPKIKVSLLWVLYVP